MELAILDSRIQQMAKTYELSQDEVSRLEWVLREYEPHEHDLQLTKEIEDIMAARKLAVMPKRPFTRDTLNRVRQYVNDTGLTNFNPDDAKDIIK